jgi:hypothetical protein
VNVGDVQQSDIAERIETQEFILGQPLLGERARESASASRKRRGRR